MTDASEWIRQEMGNAMPPGATAAYDQEFRAAEVATAALLTHYANWCGSLERDDVNYAALSHVQFMQVFGEIEQDAVFMILVSFCNTLYHELLSRHGSFPAMVQAAHEGRLFAGTDEAQLGLFRQLEDL